MIVGIFGDKHNNKRCMREAMRLFEEYGVGLILDTGDWTWPEFAEIYKAEAMCDTISVLGNNDDGKFVSGKNKRGYKTEFHEGALPITVDGKRICIYHGKFEEITEELLNCQDYDLVVTGHDHIPHLKVRGKTYWLDPGHFKVPVVGNYLDYAHPTVALYDTETNKCEIIELG